MNRYILPVIFLLTCQIITVQGKELSDKELSDFENSSLQQAICVKLNNNLQACYGPGWSKKVKRYEEPYDFYEISVEEISKTGSVVLFMKTFKTEDVFNSVLNDDSEGLANLIENSSILIFKIQEPPYEIDISKYILTDDGRWDRHLDLQLKYEGTGTQH